MAMDGVSLLFAVLGGATMGTYPVPIKAPSVLEARVHPMVFQCYKSFWVFALGWLFLIPNYFAGRAIIFEFTWWAVLSTLAWIPAGIFSIAAVPRIGMSMAFVLNAGTSAWLSFMVFWLFLDEKMLTHAIRGHNIYLAPVYCACLLFGMYRLVAAAAKPTLKKDEHVLASVDGPASFLDSDWFLGVFMALAAGVCSALQAGAVTIGRRQAMYQAGCVQMSSCPQDVQERFNSSGSWMASFGIGAALVTTVFMLALVAHQRWHGLPVPPPRFDVMRGPGSIAGILWCAGNFFITMAITRGGNSVVVPACNAIIIMTTGMWGLLYYHEVRGWDRIVRWCGAALFTLASMILLSRERA